VLASRVQDFVPADSYTPMSFRHSLPNVRYRTDRTKPAEYFVSAIHSDCPDMTTIRLQRSASGFSVNGGEPLPLDIAQRRAIDLAVALAEPVTITVHDADSLTYEFLPGALPFEWMTVGGSKRPSA